MVNQARPIAAGFSASMDAIHDVGADEMALIDRTARGRESPVTQLCRQILAIIRSGADGEIRSGWPEGSAWLLRRLPFRLALGGNAGQAANVLSVLGVPCLLALSRRTERVLAALGGHVSLATPQGGVAPATEAAVTEHIDLLYHVIEFQSGTSLPDGSVVPRSGRVVVRFEQGGLSLDENFAAVVSTRAPYMGAGLISGLCKTEVAQAPATVSWVSRHARRWRANGLDRLHLELAHHPAEWFLPWLVDALAPVIDSVGMNEAELRLLAGSGKNPAACAADIGERYKVGRVMVHSDRWALVATRADPAQERMPLLTAALVAGARASAGYPVRPCSLSSDALLMQDDDLPAADVPRGWSAVVVPTLWLARPRATIGLGDTFCAGALLAFSASGR